MAMQPWKPDDNPHQNRRLGKTNEEVNELGSVLARISIQGIDEIDPSSGKTNRQRFEEEMADVQAQINKNLAFFGLQTNAEYWARVQRKMLEMDEWEAHYKPAEPARFISSCPWCGQAGPGYEDSPRPSDVCHHDPADILDFVNAQK